MKITIEIAGNVARVIVDGDEVHSSAAPNAVERQILKETMKMADQVQRLRDDVATLTTVDQSAKALIVGLAQQIRDNVADPAALSAIADQLEAAQADLAAAVTANTAPPPPAPADAGGTAAAATGGADTGTTTTDAGATTGGTAASADTSAAPAGATDGSGPSAADPTVDAGAGADATAAQQDPAP